jgi:hypothetical protein
MPRFCIGHLEFYSLCYEMTKLCRHTVLRTVHRRLLCAQLQGDNYGIRLAVKMHTNCLMLLQDNVAGLEFSGRDRRGRRVMGMVSHGALASVVVADSSLLWDVPDHWTLEDAATVPVVYGTVSWKMKHNVKFWLLTAVTLESWFLFWNVMLYILYREGGCMSLLIYTQHSFKESSL